MTPVDAAAVLLRLGCYDEDGVGRIYLDARPGSLADIEPPDVLVKLRLARAGDLVSCTWFQGPPAGTLANCGVLVLAEDATKVLISALLTEVGFDRVELEQASRA